MMILSQDGMVAVNSDNVAMFEVKETETIPHEAQLMATIFISGGGRYTNAERICYPIGTFRSPDRTELAKLALDYISFSISSGHKVYAQVPTEDEMRNIQGAKSRADAARRVKLDDIIKELLAPEHATYGVDSMCVDGSFRKDGILVRMSSECITDDCCFHYDPTSLSPEDVEKVKGWINEIVTELHKRLPR